MRYTVYRYTPQHGNLHRQKWRLTSGSMGPLFWTNLLGQPSLFLAKRFDSSRSENPIISWILWLGKTWKDICNQEATGQGQISRRNINPIGLVPVIRFWKPPSLGSLLAVFISFHPMFFSARLPGDVLTISKSVVGSSYHKSSKKWDFIRCIVPAVRLMFGPVTVSGRY